MYCATTQILGRGEMPIFYFNLRPLIRKEWLGFCCCSSGSVCLSFFRKQRHDRYTEYHILSQYKLLTPLLLVVNGLRLLFFVVSIMVCLSASIIQSYKHHKKPNKTFFFLTKHSSNYLVPQTIATRIIKVLLHTVFWGLS